MGKHPNRTKKNVPLTSLLLLLVVSVIPAKTSATSPYISLNPSESEVESPGRSFTIDVYVTDVTDFGCWEFRLSYNTTVLDAISVSPTPYTQNNTDWVPTDALGIFHPDKPPTINDTIGQVRVGALVPVLPGKGLNGSFPLVTIDFIAMEKGPCSLDLYETLLGDSWGDPIYHTVVDGSVTVVPEFPEFVVAPLLLMTTLAAAILGKKVWSKKR